MREPQSIPIGGPDHELAASAARSAAFTAWARSASWTWVCLAVLIAVGAYLRLANLGHLGIHNDEDLTSLAVKAILQKGIPELPSGMVYLRGGPFLYAMAASAKLLGFNELALRLPAALFGIAMIPLGYLFGRSLFGVRVGLVVAALLAISIWDIEFSRYARMYAPFSFFYLLTIWCIWKYRVRTESLAGGALCVLLAMLTISLHELGYTLAAAMFFPLMLRGPREWLKPRRLAFPLCAALITAGFFFVWGTALEHLRGLPLSATGVLAPAGRLADPAPLSNGLPQLALLPAWLARSPVSFAFMGAALAAAALLFAFRRPRPALNRAALLATAVVCLFGVFNVALLGIAGVAWLQRRGVAGLRSRETVFTVSLAAAAFGVWLLATVTLGLAAPEFSGAAAVKAAMRYSLLDFPHFFVFWGFVNQWPFASIVAALGVLWSFDRAARRPTSQAAGFLLFALAAPLIINGLFSTRYELFRYDVPFDTFYFACIALGLLRWPALVHAWRGTSSSLMAKLVPHETRQGGAAAVGALLALLVLGFDLNPLRGVLLAHENYRNEGALYRLFGLEDYPDFKTPAAFVAEHAAPADVVIVLDSREMYSYLGHVDYWVRSRLYETQAYERGGELHDLYVSTPLLRTLAELERTLRTPGRTKWLVASDSMLADTRAVDADIKRFIRGAAGHVVYTGQDGVTKVYRFD